MAVDYNNILNGIEKRFRLISGGIDKAALFASRVSTGVLMQDLILGGGIMPGWYTIYGGEGAAKSTTVMSIIANSLNHEIPIVSLWDYEQAVDPQYLGNILEGIAPGGDYLTLMGERSPKTGKWAIMPRVRYYSADVGEDFYLSMGAMLRMLPDKIFTNDKWWYVFPNTKEGRAQAGGKHNKKMFTETGMYYVEAEDGGRLQALILLDSYQAMNPDAQEDDSPNGSMAQDARMHAAHIKKVRGKLRKKHCAVIGISQLRVNPGQRFGNPEYLSGGNALKHAADGRNKQTPRSSPHGSGPVESEASVLCEDGTDMYKYIHCKNEKNKFATPHCQGWLRIWIDHEGEGRGFCPAYDVFQYLLHTGRIDAGASAKEKGMIPKKFRLNLPDYGIDLEMGWLDFKAIVLLEGEELKAQCANLGIKKNPRLRQRCFEEMNSGVGFELYHSLRVGGGKSEEVEDEDEVEIDDEE